MADYRQSCATPGCGYTGFTGHSPGCRVPDEIWARKKEAEKERDQEEALWINFFKGMTDEELFEYAAREREAWSAAQKHQRRWQKARQYMLSTYKLREFLDRNRRKG